MATARDNLCALDSFLAEVIWNQRFLQNANENVGFSFGQWTKKFCSVNVEIGTLNRHLAVKFDVLKDFNSHAAIYHMVTVRETP